MRTLSERPAALLDPSTHALCAGSFRGGIPRVAPSVFGRPPWFRLAHEKRWVYFTIVASDVIIGAAVVRLGYASNSFAFLFDRAASRVVAKRSLVAPPFAASVGDTAGQGCRARFGWLDAKVMVERPSGARDYRVEIASKDLRVSARLSSAGAPPPLGAVVTLPGPPSGLFNATEKGVLLPVVGEAIAGGKHYDLNGGLGGYDFTSGHLARHTAWRWAFGLGHARGAERVGFNLVQGFVGEPECAVWVDDELYPVSEGRFEVDLDHPLSSWRVRSERGELDLEFEPGGMHAERHDFGIVTSRFIQPAGSYSGTLRLPGRAPLELDRMLGVAEDQEVTW